MCFLDELPGHETDADGKRIPSEVESREAKRAKTENGRVPELSAAEQMSPEEMNDVSAVRDGKSKQQEHEVVSAKRARTDTEEARENREKKTESAPMPPFGASAGRRVSGGRLNFSLKSAFQSHSGCDSGCAGHADAAAALSSVGMQDDVALSDTVAERTDTDPSSIEFDLHSFFPESGAKGSLLVL